MRFKLVIFLITLRVVASAQSCKFDFGTGKAAAGFTKVAPGELYTRERGYGFHPGASLAAYTDNAGSGVYKEFIASGKPFFFSVKLPEGNYDVKFFLGATNQRSANTIRIENRRLLLANLITTGTTEVRFTVHIRDSMIRNGEAGGKIKLKPRERGYAHWDDKLTLEFNDSLVKVCGLEISPNTKAATVFLAGNSTVVDQDKEPWAAWGQMFPYFFAPGSIAIANYAESGETMKAFMAERRLDKIWSMAKAGDYLFIEFAHNDQKPGSSHLDPYTTYQSLLRTWIGEAHKRRMIPVLVTSMHRRSFDSSGHIINTLDEYPEAMRQVARQEHVALVDLNAMSKTLYEAWGVERSLKAFVHFPAHSFPGQDSALKDNTHFTTYGAYELARCVIQSLRQIQSPLAKYIRKEVPLFDPLYPDAWENWYWPLSPVSGALTPDGN